MKSYVKWSFSLLLDHLLAVLASVLIFGFLGAWEFGFVTVLCAAISICFAFFIPYHDSWKVGNSDRNALKREGKDALKMRGVIAGLFASIPAFAIALVSFLCAVNGWTIAVVMDQSAVEVIYRAWFFPFSSIFPYLARFPWLYFLPTGLTTLAAGIGYYFGRSKLMLRDYLYYRRKKDTTK